MNNSRKTQAFTLVELMVTMLVIGILAAVGLANYTAYQVKARMSEAYTGVDIITKNEITYFNANQGFLTTEVTTHALSPGGGNVVEASIAPDWGWAKLGYPFPIGTSVHFGYLAVGGQTDSSGTMLYNNSTSGALGSISGNLDLFSSGEGPRCTNGLDATSLGFLAIPNYYFLVISAAANFKAGTPVKCTEEARFIEVIDNKINSHGYMVFDVGE